MIKKLYTVDDDSDDDDGGQNKKKDKKIEQGEYEQLYDKQIIVEEESKSNISEMRKANDKSEVLEDEISGRTVFSYGTGRWYFMRRMSSPFCFLPCCKVRNKRDDILFKDAKQKLYEEIDLLEIVKKLRVNQFASDVVLKPRQRDLVNFFQDYKLAGDKEPEEIMDESRSSIVPDNRKTSNLGGLGKAHAAPGNVEDLLDKKEHKPTDRIFDALDRVDPDADRVDAMTYARIVPNAEVDSATILER